MGNFYVSSLIFQHLLFDQAPCIPVIFLMHERKFTEMHEELFHIVSNLIPSIKRHPLPLAMDHEKAIVAAIKNTLSSITLVHCWNHLMRDIKAWCKNHKGKNLRM